jgi:hypothetical protein
MPLFQKLIPAFRPFTQDSHPHLLATSSYRKSHVDFSCHAVLLTGLLMTRGRLQDFDKQGQHDLRRVSLIVVSFPGFNYNLKAFTQDIRASQKSTSQGC